MKKSFSISVALVGVLIMLASAVFAGPMGDGTKKKKATTESNKNIAPNGNYKHNYPTSSNNRFKDSFTKPAKENVNRNYKQQNQAQSDVKFKDHFTKPAKTNRSSYKHPQGL